MPTDRKDFYTKYIRLSEDWNLDERVVLKVISEYSLKLANELLDETEWTLSRFFRDTRNDEEYLFDIIDGQLIEAMIVEWFKSKGYDAYRNGTDSDGKIVRSGRAKITTKADLKVNGRPIEIQMSRNTLDSYDVKEPKINRALKNNTLIMFIVPGDRYFVIDPKKDLDKAKLYANPRFGGKMCYNFNVEKYYNMIGEIDWL